MFINLSVVLYTYQRIFLPMLGFGLAFVTAVCESFKDSVSKKFLHHVDEYTAAWALRFVPFVLSLFVLPFTDFSVSGNGFWQGLFVSGFLNIITSVLYMRAIKVSDLSLSVPMITFSPLFLLMTSPFIVGEFPNMFGVVGVVFIVLGSYVLNLRNSHSGFFGPFKAIWSERGPRLMLLVAFLWSITAAFEKVAVQDSSPLFFAICLNAFITVGLSFVLFKRARWSLFKTHPGLFGVGLLSGIGLFAQFTALKYTFVAYVISVKRLSVLLSVISGGLLFKEKFLRERLFGACLMVVGVAIIALKG